MSRPSSNKFVWFRRLVEILWLFVLAVSIVEAYIHIKEGNTSRGLIFVAFGLVAFFMFNMRRRQRVKIEKRNNNDES